MTLDSVSAMKMIPIFATMPEDLEITAFFQISRPTAVVNKKAQVVLRYFCIIAVGIVAN